MGNSWPQPHRARSVFPVQDSGRGTGAGTRDRNPGGSQGWRRFFHSDPTLKDSGPAAPRMQGWHQGTQLSVELKPEHWDFPSNGTPQVMRLKRTSGVHSAMSPVLLMPIRICLHWLYIMVPKIPAGLFGPSWLTFHFTPASTGWLTMDLPAREVAFKQWQIAGFMAHGELETEPRVDSSHS